MTGVLSSPRPAPPRSGASDSRPRPALISGAAAAGYAVGLGLLAVTVPVLVGWATAADTGASASEAVAAAVQAWLVAQGAVLDVPGGTFGVVPLGLTALPATLVYVASARATRGTGVRDGRGAASLTAAMTACYALACALLTTVAGTETISARPVSAFLGGGALAAVVAGTAAARTAGLWSLGWGRIPKPLSLSLTGAAAALAVVLGSGALLAGASLALHLGRAVDLMRGLDTGTLGGLLLVLVCLVYVPTAAVWGAAFLVGPGFAVGSGTSVAMTGTTLGAVPALPLLAALPKGGTGPGLAALAVPLAAGVLAALVARRADVRGPEPHLTTWRSLALLAAGLGAAAGAGLVVLSLAVTGSGGPGRMAEVGPSPWLTGLAAAGEVALAAAVTFGVTFRGYRLRP